MSEYVLNIPYSIDLGNGFTKRTNGTEVVIEPSVIGIKPTFWNKDNFDTISFDDEEIYIGSDVINSGIKPISALGEDDISRYDSDEFKRLFFGFIARDFKQSITIPLLVTGLPVNHFKAKAKDLKKMIEGRKVVVINGEEIVIHVKEAKVMPQPLGTYMYLLAQNKVNSDEQFTLVVDGGYGTLDVTEMKGNTIVERKGDNLGVKKAYVEVYNYLVDRFGNMKHLTLSNMPYIMQKGLKVEGQLIDVAEIGDIRRILKRHFDEVFQFIRENGFDLKSFDNVVFTGGMALLHRSFIQEKDRSNFIVIDNAQEANCLGYFEFGMSILESENEGVNA